MTQKDAIEVLCFITGYSNAISEEMYFSILSDNYSIVTARLKELAIEFEDMGDAIISINNNFFDQYEISVYCSIDNYFRKYNETKNIMLILGNKDIHSLISVTNDNYTYFQYVNNNTIDHATTNFIYLKKIINLLSNQKLTDYKDDAYDRYLFLSPECGKLEIYDGGLNNLIQIVKSEAKLFDIYLKFEEMNKYQRGWEYILKNKIIRGLENVDIEKEGFNELILNLPLFIDATERDFELFLNSRKHESIIQEFENEKFIFADKIRNILYRISAGIISIPLTFFAAAFAMNEINQSWLLNIIIVSMSIYLIFTSIVNFLFWGDLNILIDEFNTRIKISSMEISRLRSDLEIIAKPYFTRIKFLKFIILCTIIIFALVLLYLAFQFACDAIPVEQNGI